MRYYWHQENNIAHGKYLLIDFAAYLNLCHEETLGLMEVFREPN